MSIDPFIEPIATTPSPRRRWALIRAALAEHHVTLRAIAERCGVTKQAVSQTAVWPSAPIEQAIAEALAVDLHRLFPDRYDRNNQSLVARRRRRSSDSTEPEGQTPDDPCAETQPLRR